MRWRLAHIGFCAWLLTGWPAYAQTSDFDSRHASDCAAVSPHDEPPSGPEVSITEVTFSGFIQMPVPDQDEIIATVKRDEHGTSLDGFVDEALERIKAGWQNHGYFKVEVTGEGKLVTKSETEIQIALFVHVDEGARYQLGGIKNNLLFSDSQKLRARFPIKDGYILSREKVAQGLESMRKAYGDLGYINYTGVPSTTFDEGKKLAYLDIDVDEGKQFVVTDVHNRTGQDCSGESSTSFHSRKVKLMTAAFGN
jgi:outer membrane protein assembly factor BamA